MDKFPEERAKIAEAALAEARAALAISQAALAERAEQLVPFAAAANEMNGYLDALFICAQFDKSKYAHEFREIGGLCRATRREEALWSSLSRVQHGKHKRTVLMYAASKGLTERASWLIARGAPIDERDSRGRPALYYACYGGHAGVARALLAAGANANVAEGSHQWPYLYLAGHLGHANTVRVLLEFGADVMATVAGNSVLHVARSTDVTRALVAAANVDINARDATDWTPLMHASFFGRVSVMRVLLSAGALIDATTLDGSSALHIASRNRQFMPAVVLVGAGADLTLTNNNGHTALDLAANDKIRILLKEAAAYNDAYKDDR